MKCLTLKSHWFLGIRAVTGTYFEALISPFLSSHTSPLYVHARIYNENKRFLEKSEIRRIYLGKKCVCTQPFQGQRG